MNTRKTVYNKLFTEKVELAKHEVELAVIEDLRKAENNFKTILLEFDALKTKYQNAKLKLEKDGQTAFDIADKYLSSARELGLNPMDNPVFKAIDAYLMSDTWRNRNK